MSRTLLRVSRAGLPALTRSATRSFQPIAAATPRFMSGRNPNPEPVWEQDADIDNIVPSNMDQATGLERMEMLAEQEGMTIFDDPNGMVGPFGTAANPVQVKSIYNERIVGCPGDCDKGDTTVNNEMRWFLVTSKKPYTCATCGQVFVIKQINSSDDTV